MLCLLDFYSKVLSIQIQNLEVDVTIKKNRKSKDEINKNLEESIIYGERNENIERQEKVNKLETSKDAAEIIQ